MKAKEKHRLFFLIGFSGLLLAISGCSTQRNSMAARLYHELTSHYNVYWNGKQSLDQGVEEIRKNAKDNFSHVLRVYNYGDNALAQQVTPLMEDAIKQASEGIQQHSMNFYGKELIHWVRNSYLLMGQANFYKKDFTAARRIFNFVAQNYSYAPVHYYGMLWLAKTYIETGDYEKADAQLNLLQSQLKNNDVPVPVRIRLPLVEADMYLAENDPDDAYPYLEEGLKTCKKRQLRTRMMFILGQINQKEGHLAKATNYFNEVIRRNPDFHLDFEARLRLATSYDTLQKDHNYVEKTLKRMASSNEYQPFLGKIYYALSQVAERSHQDSLRIHYLRLSVSHGKNDNWQRTTAAVKLATIYFRKSNYYLAQAYYDTAVQVIPKGYPDLEGLQETASVLSRVVEYMRTIRVQDSLQRLANMDTATLYALIDNKIKEYKKAQQQKAEEQNAAPAGMPSFETPSSVPQAGGLWYFYNPPAESRGYNEFIQQWGNRKLEDLWFLSQKQGFISTGSAGNNAAGSAAQHAAVGTGTKKEALNVSSPRTRAFYLKDIPRTRQDFLSSDSLILDSYKHLGFIYLETLHDTVRALKTYLALLRRFPSEPDQLQDWYTLYQVYSGLKQEDKAQAYRDLIVKHYPNSIYTRVIQNPDYYKQLAGRHAEAAKLYDRTYEAFENQQYYRALNYVERARRSYSDDTMLMPKFLYIRAVSLGKVEVPDSLYNALQLLVRSYPHSALVPRSEAIILMLQKEYGIGISPEQRAALQAKEEAKRLQDLYTFDQKAPHFVMLLVKISAVRLQPLVVRLSDFNQKYFQKTRPVIKNVPFTDTTGLVTVGNFKDAARAEAYLRALQHNAYVFSGIDKKEYELYVISLKNYSLFYKSKNIKSYQEFFNEHYQ